MQCTISLPLLDKSKVLIEYKKKGPPVGPGRDEVKPTAAYNGVHFSPMNLYP